MLVNGERKRTLGLAASYHTAAASCSSLSLRHQKDRQKVRICHDPACKLHPITAPSASPPHGRWTMACSSVKPVAPSPRHADGKSSYQFMPITLCFVLYNLADMLFYFARPSLRRHRSSRLAWMTADIGGGNALQLTSASRQMGAPKRRNQMLQASRSSWHCIVSACSAACRWFQPATGETFNTASTVALYRPLGMHAGASVGAAESVRRHADTVLCCAPDLAGMRCQEQHPHRAVCKVRKGTME